MLLKRNTRYSASYNIRMIEASLLGVVLAN